jgi:lysophospholipase L1-like esterase
LKGAIGQYLQQHFQRYLEPHLGRHGWIWLPLVGSMAANGLLIGFSSQPTVLDNIALAAIAPSRPISRPAAKPTSKPAPATKRASVHKPTYQDWVRLLGREAEAMAKRNPEHLTILAGDSLSLWFPDRLLPVNQEWLNQGISGETSKGLLHRINLWKKLKPDRIFLMVGINDLLRGESDKVILANSRSILRSLRDHHPDTTIVLQSVLPNAGAEATWEGRSKLRTASNSRIRALNQALQILTEEEGVQYIDLNSLLIDDQGNIRGEYSTDGLHLNEKGYLIWSTALQIHDQIQRQIRAGTMSF